MPIIWKVVFELVNNGSNINNNNLRGIIKEKMPLLIIGSISAFILFSFNFGTQLWHNYKLKYEYYEDRYSGLIMEKFMKRYTINMY